MNEEEKKAINDLKRTVEIYEAKPIDKISVEFDKFDYKIVKIVLNLIEKLQKENEELKEYIMLAPNLDEMTAIKYRNIQEEAYIRGRMEEQQRAEQIIYENYILIQKIKDKIEEIKERKMDIVTSPIHNRDEKIEILKKDKIRIQVLQELLENKN